jgi:hypothetical protein
MGMGSPEFVNVDPGQVCVARERRADECSRICDAIEPQSETLGHRQTIPAIGTGVRARTRPSAIFFQKAVMRRVT